MVTGSALTPEEELAYIESEIEQEHEAYKHDMKCLQQQITDLQRAVEDTKKKYTQKRKAREERINILRASIADGTQCGHGLLTQSEEHRPPPGEKDKQLAPSSFRSPISTEQHSRQPNQTTTAQHPPEPQRPQIRQSSTKEPTWLKSFQDQLLQQHQSQELLLQQHIQLQQQLMQQLIQMATQPTPETPSHSEHAQEQQHPSTTAT